MDAQLPGSSASRATEVDLRTLGALILTPVGLTSLWLLALFLLARRLSGNLTAPLDTPFLLTTGWLLFAGGFGLRACWKQPSERGPIRRSLAYSSVAILPMLLCAAALSLPGSPRLGLWLLWLLVIGISGWSISTEWPGRTGLRFHRQPKPNASITKPRKLEEAPQIDSLGGSLDVSLNGDLLQQWTRLRAADGSERISGMARVEFQPRQRQASLHIAFCPPFEKTPELVSEQLEGPASRIKIGQLQPFGARFDLRLSQPASEPQYLVVRFEARENLEE